MDDSLDFMQGMNTRQFLLSTIRGLLPSLLINIACTLIIYNLLSPHFPCAGYLDYPFQNKRFGHGFLAHFSFLQRLIFSKAFVF